jgi:hypothetical protein
VRVHTIPNGYGQPAIPPFTLTVYAHLLVSSPHLQRTRPASSTFFTPEKKGKGNRQKGATSRTSPCHLSRLWRLAFDISTRLTGPSAFSAIATRILFIWSTCQLSGILKSICSLLVVSITAATSPTVTCLGHIGRVSCLLALCGPTLAISASSAA